MCDKLREAQSGAYWCEARGVAYCMLPAHNNYYVDETDCKENPDNKKGVK